MNVLIGIASLLILGVCSTAYYFGKVDPAQYRDAGVWYPDFSPKNTNIEIHDVYSAKSQSYRKRFANTICKHLTTQNMQWLMAICFNSLYWTNWARSRCQDFCHSSWWGFPQCLAAWVSALASSAFLLVAWREGRDIQETVAITAAYVVGTKVVDYATS